MHKKTIGILVVVAVLCAGVGFWTGTQYAKPGTSNRTMFTTGGQFTGGRTSGFAGRGAGGFVSGQILTTDSGGFTIKMQDGSTKLVLLSASTTVSEMSPAPASSLKVGQQVVVSGATNSDGSVTAQMVQLRLVGN